MQIRPFPPKQEVQPEARETSGEVSSPPTPAPFDKTLPYGDGHSLSGWVSLFKTKNARSPNG